MDIQTVQLLFHLNQKDGACSQLQCCSRKLHDGESVWLLTGQAEGNTQPGGRRSMQGLVQGQDALITYSKMAEDMMSNA